MDYYDDPPEGKVVNDEDDPVESDMMGADDAEIRR